MLWKLLSALAFWKDDEVEEIAEESETGERYIAAREMVWRLELNDYQRTQLLLVLRQDVFDTGDWYKEIIQMLDKDPDYERLHWRTR